MYAYILRTLSAQVDYGVFLGNSLHWCLKHEEEKTDIPTFKRRNFPSRAALNTTFLNSIARAESHFISFKNGNYRRYKKCPIGKSRSPEFYYDWSSHTDYSGFWSLCLQGRPIDGVGNTARSLVKTGYSGHRTLSPYMKENKILIFIRIKNDHFSIYPSNSTF